MATKPTAPNMEQKIVEISKEVANVDKQAKAVVVKSEKDVQGATDFLGQIKDRITRVEALRQFFTKPLNDQVRRINDKFREQSAPLNEAFSIVKRLIGDYRMEEEHKARAEEERLAKLQEAKNKRREEKGQAPDLTPAPSIERPDTTVKTEQGRTVTKKVWKFEIQDIHQIPLNLRQQILELALQKGIADSIIRKEIGKGVREIEGVRIYEDVDISVYK